MKSEHAVSPPTADPLSAIERLALELDAGEIGDEARATAARVHERRFFVACVGQFKRGKSTLLNALVGASVLPVGVTPVTAVVTVLRYGPRLEARVRIGEGAWQPLEATGLSAYVSELENPENEKNVSAIEVFVPSALLAEGLCLVDTPGIGSVFQGNTEATRAFVPHIDAALVVLGADPPISGEELQLVERVAADVRDFVFVLAKADRMKDVELVQAKSFAARVLGRVVPGADVLEVSALERVEQPRPTRDWAKLTGALETLARTRGADLVAAAEARAVARLCAALAREVEERRRALVAPREQSELRLERLRASLREAERVLTDAGPLFGAIEQRLARRLDEEREAFLVRAREEARARLLEAIEPALAGPEAQLRILEASERIARDIIERWREERAPAAERMYAEATDDLVATASGVLRRLASDPSLAAVETPDVDTRFRTRAHFYFTEMLTLGGASLRTALLGALGGREGKRRALFARAEPYVLRLVETNAARVTNDLIDQIRESRRRLESELRRALRSAVTAAERALEAAAKASERGREGIAEELARLERLAGDIRRCSGAPERPGP